MLIHDITNIVSLTMIGILTIIKLFLIYSSLYLKINCVVYVSSYTISPFHRAQIYHSQANFEDIKARTRLKLPNMKQSLNDFSADSNDRRMKNSNFDSSSLMIMDIVLYSTMEEEGSDGEGLKIGTIIDDGSIQPLTAWSLEEAVQFSGDEYIEFLVDHSNLNHPMAKQRQQSSIIVHTVLDPITITYGSRQVGGGKGPGNPHGEESELLYYVKKSVLEANNVTIHVNPALEIQW